MVEGALAGSRPAGEVERNDRRPAGPSDRPEPRPYAPTEKQVAFFQRLVDSPVFTEEERRRALEWLATRATRQTIKDQIDWLKNQVEKRRGGQAA